MHHEALMRRLFLNQFAFKCRRFLAHCNSLRTLEEPQSGLGMTVRWGGYHWILSAVEKSLTNPHTNVIPSRMKKFSKKRSKRGILDLKQLRIHDAFSNSKSLNECIIKELSLEQSHNWVASSMSQIPRPLYLPKYFGRFWKWARPACR